MNFNPAAVANLAEPAAQSIHSSDSGGSSPPSHFLPRVVLARENTSDIDFVRVVVKLTEDFYKHDFDYDDSSLDVDASDYEYVLAEKLTEHRYDIFSQIILSAPFLKLVGTTSTVKGYGNLSNPWTVRRKFSVKQNKWESSFPFCPSENAGDEYCLIRSPVEIAIPFDYVEPVVNTIRKLGHHIDLRMNWETSHILLNDATLTNNPPRLCDIFKAMAFCGVDYFSFCFTGQRWPKVYGDFDNDGLEGPEDHFWNWLGGMQGSRIMKTTGCEVAVPMIHVARASYAGRYPATWTYNPHTVSAQKEHFQGNYGSRPTIRSYPLWNVKDEYKGGASFKFDKYHSHEQSGGLSKIKCYIDAPARVMRNYTTVNINYSHGRYPTNIYNFKTSLTTMKESAKRCYYHVETSGCSHRVEVELCFTYLPNDPKEKDFLR